MDPVTHRLLGRRCIQPPVAFAHWQGTAMRIALTLPDGLTVSDADTLVAELHSSRTSTDAPLATATAAPGAGPPWNFDFSAASLLIPITAGAAQRYLWLVIAANWTDSPEVLATAEIILQRSNYSGLTPDEPDPETSLGTITVFDSAIALTHGADTLYIPRLASVTSPGSIQLGPDIITALTIEVTHALLTVSDNIIALPALSDPGDLGTPLVSSSAITTVTAYAGHVEITTGAGTALAARIAIPS